MPPAAQYVMAKTAEQMRVMADLAQKYGFGEIRVAHEQNLVLPDIRKRDLYAFMIYARSVTSPEPLFRRRNTKS